MTDVSGRIAQLEKQLEDERANKGMEMDDQNTALVKMLADVSTQMLPYLASEKGDKRFLRPWCFRTYILADVNHFQGIRLPDNCDVYRVQCMPK